MGSEIQNGTTQRSSLHTRFRHAKRRMTPFVGIPPRLFDGEPLDFYSAFFVGGVAAGFFPASAYDFDSGGVDFSLSTSKAFDFGGSVFA